MWASDLAAAVAKAGQLTVRILGIKVEQQAILKNNPGIDPRATSVTEYFRGYKYVVTLPWRNESPDVMQENIYCWLAENNITEFAQNILRVSTGYSADDTAYVIDDIFGGDFWFWAFKNESDAILFALRW